MVTNELTTAYIKLQQKSFWASDYFFIFLTSLCYLLHDEVSK